MVTMPPPRKAKQSNQSDKDQKTINFKTSKSYNEEEDDYVASASYSDTATIIKIQELKQKLMIAANVAKKCREIKTNIVEGKVPDLSSMSIIQKLKEFTNLPEDELKDVFESITTRDRSFAKIYKDVKIIPDGTIGLLADDIRKIFISYIIEKKEFPTKMNLFQELKTLSSKYTIESVSIQRLVKNKLVKYQHFPEFNRYLLMEHPERVYQRTLYLSSVKLLRSQQRNFVYVEVRRVIPRGTAVGFIAGLAAFPNSVKIEKFFTKDSTEPIAKKWLQQRILPLVPEDSVIILAQPKAQYNLTPFSKRHQFKGWLEQNGIPFGKNPHTAELYSLVMKFKGHQTQQGIYDHVFLNAGLALIHFPFEWQNLNFFKSVWANITVMDSTHPGRPESLKQTILNSTALLTNLHETEDKLIEEEFKVMKEDSYMENILENIQEMVKRGDAQLSDFPKECSGDKTDYFEAYVSDVVIDIKL